MSEAARTSEVFTCLRRVTGLWLETNRLLRGTAIPNAEEVDVPIKLYCNGDGEWMVPIGRCTCKAGYEPENNVACKGKVGFGQQALGVCFTAKCLSPNKRFCAVGSTSPDVVFLQGAGRNLGAVVSLWFLSVLWSVARLGEQRGEGAGGGAGAAATLLEVTSVMWCLQSATLAGWALSSASDEQISPAEPGSCRQARLPWGCSDSWR